MSSECIRGFKKIWIHTHSLILMNRIFLGPKRQLDE